MSHKIKTKPEIRFSGYTDDWEQRKLGEVFNERTERSPEGELISVTINQGVVKASSLDRKDNSSSNKSNYKVVKKGDIAYNSMRMWQGASGYSPYSGILSPAYTVICPKSNIDSIFMSYMFKKHDMIQIFKRNSQGLTSDTWNLKFPALSSIKVKIPIFDEQNNISRFFKQLDDTIALHQRQLEALEKTKKSFLQKMFPKKDETKPEIRFAGFTDDWEQRKLGEVASFYKGKGYAKKDLVDVGHPILLYGSLYTNYQTVIEKVDTFTKLKENSVLSNGNEVVVPSSGESAEDIARASAINKKGIILGGDLNIIRPIKELQIVFLALILSNGLSKKELIKSAQGNSVVHVYNSDLKSVHVNYSSTKEQQKIGTFFKQLDDTIALHQRQLEALETTKKSFLQKMFV